MNSNLTFIHENDQNRGRGYYADSCFNEVAIHVVRKEGAYQWLGSMDNF